MSQNPPDDPGQSPHDPEVNPSVADAQPDQVVGDPAVGQQPGSFGQPVDPNAPVADPYSAGSPYSSPVPEGPGPYDQPPPAGQSQSGQPGSYPQQPPQQQGQPPYQQGGYGQQPTGQPPYPQGGYGQQPVGQPPYPQPPYGGPGPGGVVAQPMSQGDERLWATLAHISIPLIGFVGPLIVYLVFKDRSAWLKENSTEALNFSILYSIASLIASVSTGIIIGFVLWPLVFIAALVFCILAAIAANKGDSYKYPVNWRLVK